MEEIDPQEQKAFERLAAEQFNSPELEARIIGALSDKGLLERPQKASKMKKIALQIAASIALLVGGYFIGQEMTTTETEALAMDQYMLLLYENEQFEYQDGLVAEYTQWAVDLSEKGKLAYAEKLADEAPHWLGNASTQNASSNVSGYFVFYAENFTEAKAVANTHPHVNYGGGLELRRIDN